MATVRKFGYRDLEFIATILENEGITPQTVSDVVKNAKIMAEKILKKIDNEYKEQYKKVK